MSKDQPTQLRSIAREIFDASLVAVDAREVTRKAIGVEGNRIRIGQTVLDATKPIYVVSLGKASMAMAEALSETLGERITNGIITGPQPQRLSANWQVFSGGHPLPNADSLNAASAAFQLLDKANDEHAVVIFAVSGGGSAMIEWPSSSAISLDDLREANRILVACGATIAEINAVRRAFSAVKGGKLAARAPKAEIVTLLISDTNHGDEVSIASGPSLPSRDTRAAEEIVAKFQLEGKLPRTIIEAIRESEEQIRTPSIRESHYVLAENQTALDTALARATSLGFRTICADEISEQPITEGCELLIQRLAKEPAPVCLISGGEFACTVRGDGRGGRNLETVLRCALSIAGQSEHIVVLSAGTDGIDGNSPAAGAVADETTLSRAKSLGLEVSTFLERSDSFGFFERLGAAIITGPTATNVRDVRVILKVAAD